MGTTSTFFGGAGGGGGDTANFKAASSISANAPVVLKSNGTIDNLSSTVTTSSYGTTSQAQSTAANNYRSGGHYNYTTNTIVISFYRNSSYKLIAGTVASNGTITWGSETTVTGMSASGADYKSIVTYDPVYDKYIIFGNGSSNRLEARSFSISGTTITLTGSNSFIYYYYFEDFDAKYIPDTGVHAFYGVSSSNSSYLGRLYLDSSGTIYGSLNNVELASIGNGPSDSGQMATLCDMGGGLVGVLRSCNSSTSPNLLGSGTVSVSGVSGTRIRNGFTWTGILPTAQTVFMEADRENQYIIMMFTQSSSYTQIKILSYSDFLNFPDGSNIETITYSTNDGYLRDLASNAKGEIFMLHFNDSYNRNHITKFNIKGGFLSNISKVETNQSNQDALNRSTIIPSEFGPEAWIMGLNQQSEILKARNIEFAGVNTNKDGVIGYAADAISSGSVGTVNLITRDVKATGLQSSQIFQDGEEYYENSSGTSMSTSGSNLVGYGNDGGIKVIGEAP